MAGARPSHPGHARAGALLIWRSASRTCSSTATACLPTSMPARRNSSAMSPCGLRGAPRPRRVLEAARPARQFLRRPSADARCAAAVPGGEASEADHPHRPSARHLGGAAKGALGSRAFPGRSDHHHHGARRNICTWNRATSSSTTATSTGISGKAPAVSSSITRTRRFSRAARGNLSVGENGSVRLRPPF